MRTDFPSDRPSDDQNTGLDSVQSADVAPSIQNQLHVVAGSAETFLSQHMPGFALCGLLALSSLFISETTSIPVMLVALIIGLGMHHLSSVPALSEGFSWTSRSILYAGVALMGLRIDSTDLSMTGTLAPVAVLIILFATFAFGYCLARMMGLTKSFAVLMAGAVAVCGVAAAAAICCAIPHTKEGDRELAVTIAGITVLSTIAMISYPVLVLSLGLGDMASGFVIGGAVHNVSQAVGAGYAVSDGTGDIALLLKMVRVSALLPLVLLVSLMMKRHVGGAENGKASRFNTYFPPFLLVFAALAVVNFLGFVPEIAAETGDRVARYFLITSLIAIGIKTNLRDVIKVGVKPLITMAAASIFMLATALVAASFTT